MANDGLTRRRFLATAAAGAALGLPLSEAQAAGWEFLGSRSVRLTKDVDVISVTAAQGKFRSIQLRVRDNGIFMNDLVVTFGNGGKMDVPLRKRIPKGGRTRVIDLPGRKRVIRSVRMNYRSEADLQGRATVELWAR